MEALRSEQKELYSDKERLTLHNEKIEKTMANMEAYMSEVEALIDRSDNELAKHYAKLEDKERRT